MDEPTIEPTPTPVPRAQTSAEPDGPTSGWIIPPPPAPAPIEGWTVTPSPPSAGRPLWSLWWRWIAVTFGAELAVTIVYSVIYAANEGHTGTPTPVYGVIAWAASTIILVAALQGRLLRGHVRAPGRWLAIGIVDAAAYGLYILAQFNLTDEVVTSSEHTSIGYLLSAGTAAVVAVAQWWFVLRAGVPRSVVWVPIVVVADVASAAIPDLLDAVGLPSLAGWAVWLIVPVVGATGMVYVLRDKLDRARPSTPADERPMATG